MLKPSRLGMRLSRRPAAFRRLCVETGSLGRVRKKVYQPPSGGCVLKHCDFDCFFLCENSRLQAAVC